MSLLTKTLKFEEKNLFVPTLEKLKEVLQNCLSKNFEYVKVGVEQCPDLKSKGLMGSGLGGSTLLLEVGGPPFLLPLVQRSKLYNMKEIVQRAMGENCEGPIFAMGAGAGPFPIRNTNCEGIYNFFIDAEGNYQNGSYTAKVAGPNEDCVLEKIPETEARCALLLNLFVCRGEPGEILTISCKKRLGDLNFIEAIRKGLEEEFKDQEQCVGLGGMFKILKGGKAHQHVMRDFSTTPIHTDEDVNNWLKFYDMPGELTAVGTLVTHEHDLDLRLQHFHSFSDSNWGGHYHYDTTPEIIEYEAYLNVAQRVVRVDRPIESHKIGRD